MPIKFLSICCCDPISHVERWFTNLIFIQEIFTETDSKLSVDKVIIVYAPASEPEIKIENEVFLPAYEENIGDSRLPNQKTRTINVSITFVSSNWKLLEIHKESFWQNDIMTSENQRQKDFNLLIIIKEFLFSIVYLQLFLSFRLFNTMISNMIPTSLWFHKLR